MLSNKDIRVEGRNLIINGEKHPLDPAVNALTKRANIVQVKFSALDAKLDAIEALEKTASGNHISLTGVAAAYAISNIMTIEPIQSGSGDPSPTNVRPISGINTATVQTTNGEDTNTANITFGQTVYGGSVNFKTGEVTVTHGIVDLGDYDYQITQGLFTMPNAVISDAKAPTAQGIESAFCSAYKHYYTGEAINLSDIPDKSFVLCTTSMSTTRKIVVIKDSSYNDPAAFKTAMSGVQLCYELATPVTLTFTPAELELLKGANTVSGNGANINLSYIGR